MTQEAIDASIHFIYDVFIFGNRFQYTLTSRQLTTQTRKQESNRG